MAISEKTVLMALVFAETIVLFSQNKSDKADSDYKPFFWNLNIVFLALFAKGRFQPFNELGGAFDKAHNLRNGVGGRGN